MDLIMLIGRILLASTFVANGIAHLTNPGPTGFAQYKKVPAPALLTKLSGVLMIAGSAGFALGIAGDLAAVLTAVLLVIITVKMHDFWTIEDAPARQAEMAGFMKNISMIGGLLVVAWALSLDGAAYTITDGVL